MVRGVEYGVIGTRDSLEDSIRDSGSGLVRRGSTRPNPTHVMPLL